MEGSNNPERLSRTEAQSPNDRFSSLSNNSNSGGGDNNNEDTRSYGTGVVSGKKIRDLGTDIEMTAAVSGVVPDGKQQGFTFFE